MGVVDALLNLDARTGLTSIGTFALVYAVIRVLGYLVSYRKSFIFFNACQGVKDYSWKHGNLHLYPLDFEKRARVEMAWIGSFPKYYRVWIGPLMPIIRVYHPDTIRSIIKSTEPKPRTHGGSYEALVPWLGEGLLVSEGKRWARSRRLLTPGFHFDILKPYVDITNQAVDKMMIKIEQRVKEGTSFDLFEMISVCSFDILLRCAMSIEEDFQTQGSNHPYLRAINGILELLSDRTFTPFHHYDFIYWKTAKGRKFRKLCEYVHKYSEDIIQKRRQSLQGEELPKSRYLDFLDILLTARDDEGKGLSPLEIRNEVDTFLFEGHDTTTSGISWTLFTLANRPEIQAGVQKELDDLLGARQSKHIGWNDINKLKYFNRCLKESMRFNSPVPLVSRRLEREMDIDGKIFPSGTIVSIGIWHVHHNPDVWENPDVYDPDRFLPENIKKKDHYAYIPFSAGPRNCIGQHFALNEQKVVIGRVLERYQLTPDPDHKVGRRIAGVMKSTEGLWVFAKHRN